MRDFFAADATVLYDDPEKLRNAVADEYKRLAAELDTLIQHAENEVLFISPYYVPGKSGVEYAHSLVDKGVRTVVLTNSLASNNHVPVHSGYTRYRKRVIEAGVELYEARANAGRILQAGEGPDLLTLHTIRWHAVIDGETVIETNEPQAGTWLRFKAWFMKIAPESQL